MLDVLINRVFQKGLATVGLLSIDKGPVECFTLEDGYLVYKQPGQSRIPPGTYRLALRKDGAMSARYEARFGAEHEGMLWLLDVPNFEYIYLHTGVDERDTKGCVLVGDNVSSKPALSQSAAAYSRIYRRIANAIKSVGARVILTDENDGLERHYF